MFKYFQLLFAPVSFNLSEENMLIREIIKWIDNACRATPKRVTNKTNAFDITLFSFFLVIV